jgi:hypothetical protein
MDQRLLDQTQQFMHALNLENRFDQLTLAGGAMGVNQLPKELPHDSPAKWWNVFTAHLGAAITKLHRPIKDIFLLDHLDCGAYKYLYLQGDQAEAYAHASLEEMKHFHVKELHELASRVRLFCKDMQNDAERKRKKVLGSCSPGTPCKKSAKEWQDQLVEAWKDIRVSCFIMDLCGVVTQLDVKHEETASLRL